jgi:hypothetical protein
MCASDFIVWEHSSLAVTACASVQGEISSWSNMSHAPVVFAVEAIMLPSYRQNFNGTIMLMSWKRQRRHSMLVEEYEPRIGGIRSWSNNASGNDFFLQSVLLTRDTGGLLAASVSRRIQVKLGCRRLERFEITRRKLSHAVWSPAFSTRVSRGSNYLNQVTW